MCITDMPPHTTVEWCASDMSKLWDLMWASDMSKLLVKCISASDNVQIVDKRKTRF